MGPGVVGGTLTIIPVSSHQNGKTRKHSRVLMLERYRRVFLLGLPTQWSDQRGYARYAGVLGISLSYRMSQLAGILEGTGDMEGGMAFEIGREVATSRRVCALFRHERSVVILDRRRLAE